MDVKSVVEFKKNPKIPDFRAGDTVRVLARVVEGERERVQAFEGVVIRKRRGGINSNFTVRRVAHGIGVERTFLLHSPRLESVQVVRVGRVRRSRLYYLRGRMGKKARIRVGSRDRFEEMARQVAAAGEAPEETPQEMEEEAAVEGAEEAGAEAEGAVEAEEMEQGAVEAEEEAGVEAGVEAGAEEHEPEAEAAAEADAEKPAD